MTIWGLCGFLRVPFCDQQRIIPFNEALKHSLRPEGAAQSFLHKGEESGEERRKVDKKKIVGQERKMRRDEERRMLSYLLA